MKTIINLSQPILIQLKGGVVQAGVWIAQSTSGPTIQLRQERVNWQLLAYRDGGNEWRKIASEFVGVWLADRNILSMQRFNEESGDVRF